MAELFGLSLAQHLDLILAEAETHQSLYGYPFKKVFRPDPARDLGVIFHGKRAATPLGPASGPHTQMVQNILLAFLGGSRIMELKTVQILDQLEIPRPCIDARNVGYNVEWSQELRLEDSYHEYVTAWILLKIIEELELTGVPKGDPFYDFIFDLSVGYSLEGISSPQVTNWIRNMMDATQAISSALAQLPERHARWRDFKVNPNIASSLTLSTFHGCPREEIEGIVRYLVGELGLDVLVKMNPTQLGYGTLSKLLQQDLGYGHIELEPHAFESDLQFDEAVAMMQRLEVFAGERGRRVGAKFTNTLVVKNRENVFRDEVMYLSGTPLHVLAMNAMLNFRLEVGAQIPISFSAGINSENFVDAVLCGLTPVTTCTDLLGKGGYSRQVSYLKKLEKAMEEQDCRTISQLICSHAGLDQVQQAGLLNARKLVPPLVNNPRYHFRNNQNTPKKVGSKLDFFDCLTCNICLPVCPNGANFSLPLGKQKQTISHLKQTAQGLVEDRSETFQLEKAAQIANLADFCNECGNCDTFCPEDGGPYLIKPRFFASKASWERFSDHDGFYFAGENTLVGRFQGAVYRLSHLPEGQINFEGPMGDLLLDGSDRLLKANTRLVLGETLDMTIYYRMKYLFAGFLSSRGSYAVGIVLPFGEN